LKVLIAEPYDVPRRGLHAIFAQDPRVLNVHEVTTKEDLQTCIVSFQFDLIVVNQSLMIDILMLKAKKFVVLTPHPDLKAFTDAYYSGALGYLSTNVSAELLCTFLNPVQKSFLIEPTLGPWVMGTIFHLLYHFSGSQIGIYRKSLRSVLPGRNRANRAAKLYFVTEKLIMLILYLYK